MRADTPELAGELFGPVVTLLPQHGEPAPGAGPLGGLEPVLALASGPYVVWALRADLPGSRAGLGR